MAKMMLNLAILLTLLTVATSETTDHFVCRRARNARYGGFAAETVNHTRSAKGPPGERGAPGVPGERGPPGNPESVDYELISRIIAEEIREGLERLNSKIDMLQSNTSELAAGLEEVKSKVDTLQKFRERVEANFTDIRLVGGSSAKEGRVEVFYKGEWGTICDDGWDFYDANVVCRMLGYSKTLSAPCCAKYGEGSGRIWLDNVHCIGSESTLWDCSKKAWGDQDCLHDEDASVVCGP